MATQESIPGMESLVKQELTPTSLIKMAWESGNVKDLAELMDLELRWRAAESKRLFDSALEAFRRNPPTIEKTGRVYIPTKDGEAMTYSHAELDKANKIVTDALLAVGLSHSWKPGESKEGKTTMALILRGFGHTEDMGALTGPPDLSGGKNAIQAIGSTTKYLQRYVLLATLGLVSEGGDDDGRSGTGGLPENTVREYCTAIQDATGFEATKTVFQEAWNKAGDCSDEPAQMRFLKVFNEKKKKIQAEKSNGRG